MNISFDIFAALGAMLCWGFGDFIIQKATRVIGDMEALAWIGVFGSIGLLPFVWHDFSLVANRSNFGILLILGIVTFIIGIVNFEALRRGKISIVEVILEAELPIAVLLGLVFFRIIIELADNSHSSCIHRHYFNCSRTGTNKKEAFSGERRYPCTHCRSRLWIDRFPDCSRRKNNLSASYDLVYMGNIHNYLSYLYGMERRSPPFFERCNKAQGAYHQYGRY